MDVRPDKRKRLAPVVRSSSDSTSEDERTDSSSLECSVNSTALNAAVSAIFCKHLASVHAKVTTSSCGCVVTVLEGPVHSARPCPVTANVCKPLHRDNGTCVPSTGFFVCMCCTEFS